MKKITMQDIADKLSITKVSVSKAINNKQGISNETRQRILAVAAEMGYLGKKVEGKTFVFVVSRRFFLETDKFYNPIFYHLNQLTTTDGHQLIPIVVETEDDEITLPQQVNGIFLVGELSDEHIKQFTKTNIPIVAVDFYKSYLNVNYVLVDNFYQSYSATSHLIRNGHTKIGFVGNINQTSSINDRYFGYLKALQNANLPFNDDWIIANNHPKTGLYEINLDFPKKMPTAFICHCDMAAYFLINSLNKIGLQVPKDVSLISFDNTDLSQNTKPQLTVMDINKKAIAETAFFAMQQTLNGKIHCHRYYIPAKLIERDSVWVCV
ncbi:MAG: LacI family DNA-binding transcriptional regulator [Firmicutes bacterium]|nr:LacI family DNA-binding transcriptional regulator [Bacillota bacterium]